MKAYVLQIIALPLVFIRYDLLRIATKKLSRFKSRNPRFRRDIAWKRWESIWIPQHEFNKI